MAIDDFSILYITCHAAKIVSGVLSISNSCQINIVRSCHRQIPHGRSIQITEKADIVKRGRGDRHSGNRMAATIEGALKVVTCIEAFISPYRYPISLEAARHALGRFRQRDIVRKRNRTVLEALGGGIGISIGFIGIGDCLPVIRHPSDPREAAGGLDGVGSAGDGDIGASRADIG